MRHKVSGWKLNKGNAHRKALLRNLVADLICHEKIMTTEAKARAMRPAAEKMITLAKRGLSAGESNPASEVAARRRVAARLPRFRTLEDEEGRKVDVDVVQQLFSDIAPRFRDRPGGYTRLIKIGKRPGDNADMAVVMLVE